MINLSPNSPRLLHLSIEWLRMSRFPSLLSANVPLRSYSRIATTPILAYPSFGKGFVLETDASIQGLGAVLSHVQDDGQLHPVAFVSHSLYSSEASLSLRHWLLFGLSSTSIICCTDIMTVYVDHSAVKAVLETPNPSGKHARWWVRVYQKGAWSVKIIHCSGRTNMELMHSPVLPWPVVNTALKNKW